MTSPTRPSFAAMADRGRLLTYLWTLQNGQKAPFADLNTRFQKSMQPTARALNGEGRAVMDMGGVSIVASIPSDTTADCDLIDGERELVRRVLASLHLQQTVTTDDLALMIAPPGADRVVQALVDDTVIHVNAGVLTLRWGAVLSAAEAAALLPTPAPETPDMVFEDFPAEVDDATWRYLYKVVMAGPRGGLFMDHGSERKRANLIDGGYLRKDSDTGRYTYHSPFDAEIPAEHWDAVIAASAEIIRVLHDDGADTLDDLRETEDVQTEADDDDGDGDGADLGPVRVAYPDIQVDLALRRLHPPLIVRARRGWALATGKPRPNAEQLRERKAAKEQAEAEAAAKAAQEQADREREEAQATTDQPAANPEQHSGHPVEPPEWWSKLPANVATKEDIEAFAERFGQQIGTMSQGLSDLWLNQFGENSDSGRRLIPIKVATVKDVRDRILVILRCEGPMTMDHMKKHRFSPNRRLKVNAALEELRSKRCVVKGVDSKWYLQTPEPFMTWDELDARVRAERTAV